MSFVVPLAAARVPVAIPADNREAQAMSGGTSQGHLLTPEPGLMRITEPEDAA